MLKKFFKYSIATVITFMGIILTVNAADMHTAAWDDNYKNTNCTNEVFTIGNWSTNEYGVCAFKDSAGKGVYCLVKGSGEVGSSTRRPFGFDLDYNKSETIEGKGMACALVDFYKSGITDFSNLSPAKQQEVQIALWKNEDITATCNEVEVSRTNNNEASIKLATEDTNLKYDEKNELYVSSKIVVTRKTSFNDSNNYTVTLENAPEGSYVSTTPAGEKLMTGEAARLPIETLYINIPSSKVKENDAIKVKLVVSSNLTLYEYNWITPVITKYVSSVEKNASGQKYQDIGVVSIKTGTKTMSSTVSDFLELTIPATVEVEDTYKGTTAYIIIGSILVVSGGLLTYLTIKKKKEIDSI